ncbi:hypothetical protein [Lentzea terrae]|uniref:hypothetical protein n=1 Tax=Lentzea terrae TaxID=2200761 RepID=UPI001300333D|nr:hypothetical protein [Lentzea terrae]
MPATDSRPPVIEVAISIDARRDSDTGVDGIVVVLDGQLLRPDRYRVVVIGSESESKTSLRDEAWCVTREGSEAYTELLDLWYGRAERHADNDFVAVAQCVQPRIRRAFELSAKTWFEASEQDNLTRRAALGVVVATAFHTHEFGSPGPGALDIALWRYQEAAVHAQDAGLDVVLIDMLRDLRHLAEAYGIRLETAPAPTELMAMDLRVVISAIRDAARGQWAWALAATGTTLAEVEYRAFQAFLSDCTESDEPQA